MYGTAGLVEALRFQRRRSRSAAFICRSLASRSARLRRTTAFWALVRKRCVAPRQPVAPQSETRAVGIFGGCLAMKPSSTARAA